MYKDISKAYIYENLILGFKFELFSPEKRNVLAERLSFVLDKRVHSLDTNDTDFPLDENIFKLEPAFKGGHKMHELTTGPQPYFEAINTLYKVCNFILENAYTTDRCKFVANVSINENALNLQTPMNQLNTFKFVVGLDEAKMFELWPNEYQSKVNKVHKSTISYIYPKNRFISETFNPNTMTSSAEYNLPQSKFHGVDFTHVAAGYVGIRYAGGIRYEHKKAQLTEMINIAGERLYEVLLNNKTYTPAEVHKITSILERQKSILTKMRTFENFKLNYPNIRFTVDMKESYEGCKQRYIQMRDKIAELFEYTDIQKADINYDSERKRIQVKGADIRSSYVLNGYDFFECKVEAELKDCLVYECNVISSLLKNVYLSHGNTLRYCYLDECKYNDAADNTIKYSYLKNGESDRISGNLTECIINKGILSGLSVVDGKTEMVHVVKDKTNLL